MAPSLRSPRSHVERRLARHLAQRSSFTPRDDSSASSVAATPTPTSSQSSTPGGGVTLPPHGAAALVGIVVTLCVFVFAFAAWRFWVWKSKKAASTEFSEKKQHGLFSPVSDAHSIKRSMSQSSSVLDVALPSDVKAALTHDRYPQEFKINLNYQPKVVYAEPESHEKSKDVLPPSITVTPAVSLQITPPPNYAEIPASALSPRTASRVQSMVLPPPSAKLPRLVIVDTTFTTTLHDELEIREGETLRLLEEYEDEWCLVQRVGPADAERGVVPRFCVVDKPEPEPARKSKHIPRLSSMLKI